MPDGTRRVGGPSHKKRMETIDNEVTARTLQYLEGNERQRRPVLRVVELDARWASATHVKAEALAA